MIKEGIHINGIYQHYKEGFYKIIDIAYHHEDLSKYSIVIYHRCDEHGVYKCLKIIRNSIDEFIVPQPFYRLVSEFSEDVLINQGNYKTPVKRFKLIKQL